MDTLNTPIRPTGLRGQVGIVGITDPSGCPTTWKGPPRRGHPDHCEGVPPRPTPDPRGQEFRLARPSTPEEGVGRATTTYDSKSPGVGKRPQSKSVCRRDPGETGT